METELFFFGLTLISMLMVLGSYVLGRVWIIAATTILLILANITGPKIVSVFGYAITAGTALFAALPLATDLITERYGRTIAKQAVFSAFLGMMFFIIVGFFVTAMTALPFAAEAGQVVDAVFAQSLRLLLASPIAYLVWQLIDILIYHAILKRTGEKLLWLRNNVSTFIAQAGSTLMFFALAFAGTGTPWLEIAVVSIGFYWVIALIDTPIIYLSKLIRPINSSQVSTSD